MNTPASIEREIQQLSENIDHLVTVIAWHQAKRDWRKRLFKKAEAVAQLEYKGPAWKAKLYSVEKTEQEQIDLDIAEAELTFCLERKHANDKLVMTTLGRSKSVNGSYGLGY